MANKRRLEDLFVVGKEVALNDDAVDEEGNPYPPIVVWMQKLTPADHSIAMRKANGERARIASLIRKPDSDPEYMEAIRDRVELLPREQLVEACIAEELGRKMRAAEAQVSARDEWQEEGYLKGLQEAWENGLLMDWAENPEDPEPKRVKDELERFAKEVEAMVTDARDELASQWDGVPDDDIIEEAIKIEISGEADLAWLKEYRLYELWLAVRDPDNHKMRYFDEKEDIQKLQNPIRNRLLDEYREISVDAIEGKGLQAVGNSLDSSTPPAESDTENSSGQQESPA